MVPVHDLFEARPRASAGSLDCVAGRGWQMNERGISKPSSVFAAAPHRPLMLLLGLHLLSDQWLCWILTGV